MCLDTINLSLSRERERSQQNKTRGRTGYPVASRDIRPGIKKSTSGLAPGTAYIISGPSPMKALVLIDNHMKNRALDRRTDYQTDALFNHYLNRQMPDKKK